MSAIAYAKESAVSGMEMFLRNFSHVPDDKLNWAPAPTAKSALRIAAHTSLYAARFAWMIRERKLPSSEGLEAWLARRNAEEMAITSREEIEPIFRKGTTELLAALDALKGEDLEECLPGTTLSMSHVITIPGMHAFLHTGQIDLLQTCWDDQEIYLG